MKLTVAAAMIVDAEGSVLCVRRGAKGFPSTANKWEFPGGKIEPGETPQEALVREIKEELDIEIEVKDFLETVEYDYPEFHLSMDCFFCSIRSGELVLKEHEAAKWLTVETLDSVDWLPADQGLVEEIRKYLRQF